MVRCYWLIVILCRVCFIDFGSPISSFPHSPHVITHHHTLAVKPIRTDSSESAVAALTNEAKHGHAQAQFALGTCFADGLAVGHDSKRAVELYAAAAEQGNARAQF